MEDKSEDKKKAGISYVYIFFNNILNLTNRSAIYLNLLTELRAKYELDNLDNLNEDERLNLIQTAQLCRQDTVLCYTQYRSLKSILKLTDNIDLKDTYDNIKKNLIIDYEILENFVIELNQILVNSIVKELLDTNESLINDLYGSKQ